MGAGSGRAGSDESVRVLTGHRKRVNALASLHGGWVASGSSDKTIKLWAPKTGKCVRTLRSPAAVFALVSLPEAQLASAGLFGHIRIWNAGTGVCVRTLGHGSTILALATLPEGILASGSSDGIVKLWDAGTCQCMRTLSGHSGGVCALAQLPGSRVASGSGDYTVKVWGTESGECSCTITGHRSHVLALAPLPGGLLASGSGDKTIKLWATEAPPKCLRTLEGHSNWVHALAQLPMNRLASGSDDGTVKLWATETGECLFTRTWHHDYVRSLVWLPEDILASGSADRTIRLWNIDPVELAAGTALAAGMSSMSSTVPVDPACAEDSAHETSSESDSPVPADAVPEAPRLSYWERPRAHSGVLGQGQRPYLLLSGDFDDEDRVAYAEGLQELLQAREVPVLMVGREGLFEQPVEGLQCMKALCVICRADYGSRSRESCEAFSELEYAYMNAVPILAVQLCEKWPPQPEDLAGKAQNDLVLKNCLIRVDGRSLSAEGVAAVISGTWHSLR